MDPRTSAPTSGVWRHASERRIAGTTTPGQARGDSGDQQLPKPTRIRRRRPAKGPASAPANRARKTNNDPAPAQFLGPGAHHQQHPPQCQPPPPYRGTQAWQPGHGPPPGKIHTAQGPPLAQGQGAWHHQRHQHARATPDPYSLMPQYRSDPHRLHQQQVPAKPDPTRNLPHAVHWTAPHHHIEAVPRTPWLGYSIQPVSGPLTPCMEGKTGLRPTNPMYGRRPLTPGASPAGACSVP